MRYLASFFFIVFSLACDSTYIEDHTSYKHDYVSGEARITVAIESNDDIDETLIEDLQWVHNRFIETVLPEDRDLKNIKVFFPESEESFFRVCGRPSKKGKRRIGCIDIFKMMEGNIIISINPERLEESRENIVETLSHELTHYVSYRIDGTGDGSHLNPDYWRPNGLVNQITLEWKESIDSD